MSISELEDDLKDAIVDIVSDEYYHRTGGDTRHWLEGIELVLGGIASAFLIPYLKKLAEKSANATWAAITASSKKDSDATTRDSESAQIAESLLTRATPDDHRAASEIAAESVRVEMQKHNLSDKAKLIVIQNLLVEIEKISRSEGE